VNGEEPAETESLDVYLSVDREKVNQNIIRHSTG
jgi:hypothetical protein